MPFNPPALDDRSFDDLVQELLARIPAHTPEWTNPRLGDPGRTLIELFAWLGDTLLYRANLVPERQRLAFLRLLGEQMRPAIPARGLITLTLDGESARVHKLRPLATVKGPVNFETRAEVTVLPITMQAFYKRPLTSDEATAMADVIDELTAIFTPDFQSLRSATGDQASQAARPYVTTPIFADGQPQPAGFDLTVSALDKALWLAILAPTADLVDAVRLALGGDADGNAQLLNVGLLPAIEVPDLFAPNQLFAGGQRAGIPHLWEITGTDGEGKARYFTIDVIEDTTAQLTRRGIQRLALPAAEFIGAPTNDVRTMVDAGVGDQPPRLDDPAAAARLVTWLRLRPDTQGQAQPPSIDLSWIGVNAVEIDQRRTITGRIIGQSNGAADQLLQLPGQSVEAETLQLQVEERGRGFQPWGQIEDLALAGRDATVFALDREAGTIQFGDGVRGRIPEAGSRVRVALLRAGGGKVGNLPAGSLQGISAFDLAGQARHDLKVGQALPTDGGVDQETLAAAERRVPGLLRNHDRLITAADYRDLAVDTPGVRMGRVEVLPKFRPQQRLFNVLGVVSVLVLPDKATQKAPNPRPDRPFLETVHAWLDARRPLGTELYVIGCEYVAIGLSVGVALRDGFGQEETLLAVREALYRYLWPLPGGGPLDEGWPLGGEVRDRELEVAVARVAGVRGVRSLNLFTRQGDEWRLIQRPTGDNAAPVSISLLAWQLPELLSVVVLAEQDAPTTLDGVPNPFATAAGIAIPVVPEVCA